MNERGIQPTEQRGPGGGRGSRRSRLAGAVFVALLAPLLGGCQLLGLPPGPFPVPDGGMGFDEEPVPEPGVDPDMGWEPDMGFPEPRVIAIYTTGSAVVALGDGTTIRLDRVAEGSGVNAAFGSDVRWIGPDGWNLRLLGAGVEEEFGGPAFLQLDRIRGGEHWTSWDDGRCIVDVEVADEDGVRGTAICRDARWYDALGSTLDDWGPEPLDVPAFDAEITFEARAEQPPD